MEKRIMGSAKNLLAGSLACAAVLVACGGEKLVKTGDKLVFMGDSITEFGKNRTHGYVNLVVKGLAANGIHPVWVGVGIQGHTSGDMLRRFDKDEEKALRFLMMQLQVQHQLRIRYYRQQQIRLRSLHP